MSKLQESRKKEIPNLIAKYKKLVDDTFDAVTKTLPVFEDQLNKEGEVIATGEQLLFKYIDTRNKALDNANQMLIKMNELELELNAPELLEKEKEDEDEEGKPTNWTKKKAAEIK